jgi:hypothetical protein
LRQWQFQFDYLRNGQDNAGKVEKDIGHRISPCHCIGVYASTTGFLECPGILNRNALKYDNKDEANDDAGGEYKHKPGDDLRS